MAAIHHGDCREHMRSVIAPGSVHSICTSPPYFALRDYKIPGVDWADGWHGVFGAEPTVQQYVDHTLELFECLGRVLREDGVIFWNVGDSFGPNGSKLMIPHRVAIALQDAGWVVRQDIVWQKPSPMPESLGGWHWRRCRVKVGNSVRAASGTYHAESSAKPHGNRDGAAFDSSAKWKPCPGCAKCDVNGGYVLVRKAWRPTNAHEYIFMVTKGMDYFSDAENVAEESISGPRPGKPAVFGGAEKSTGYGTRRHSGNEYAERETRNPRSVWKLSSEPLKAAHFAAYPSSLPHKCLQAAISPGGCCNQCGSQYAPITEKVRVPTRPGTDSKVNGHDKGDVIGNRDAQRHVQKTQVHGYRQTCNCTNSVSVPQTVYDPFAGSGTTLQVAQALGLNAIGSEIAEHYLPIIDERLKQTPRCLMPKGKSLKRMKRESDKRDAERFRAFLKVQHLLFK